MFNVLTLIPQNCVAKTIWKSLYFNVYYYELNKFNPIKTTISSASEPVFSIESGRVFHVLWGAICWPLDVSCKFLSDRYFSVHFTPKIGDVKLSTNVVYGRNGLCIKQKIFNRFAKWNKADIVK